MTNAETVRPTPRVASQQAPEPQPAATSSQTAGPYWHLIDFPEWSDTTRHFAGALPAGERIILIGTVRDGSDALVMDAMVEIWHADPGGRYPDPEGPEAEFQGYGRCRTGKDGQFRFTTIKPGPVPAAGGRNTPQAPHVAIMLFARGLLKSLSTRLYFAGEALNETDLILCAVPDPERRTTLIAKPDGVAEGLPVWRLDIRLQGAGETVFLDI
jgi:protocatechuate 3,4-dioxygenase, alpha subunit